MSHQVNSIKNLFDYLLKKINHAVIQLLELKFVSFPSFWMLAAGLPVNWAEGGKDHKENPSLHHSHRFMTCSCLLYYICVCVVYICSPGSHGAVIPLTHHPSVAI